MKKELIGVLLCTTCFFQAQAQAQGQGQVQAQVQDMAQTDRESGGREAEELIAAYDEARDAFMAAYSAAESDEESQEAFKLFPNPGDWAVKFWAIADPNPGSEQAKLAVFWIAKNVGDKDHERKAAKEILKHFWKADEIKDTLAGLSRLSIDESGEILEKVYVGHENNDCQGLAGYYLGVWQSSNERDTAVAIAEFLRDVAEEFGAVAHPYRSGKTLGDMVDGMIFELEHLQVGMTAPDIEGRDIDGSDFKLSDYVGKVILLDYWSHL